MNWYDSNYLKTGTDQQRILYELLCKHTILSRLTEFDPVLVGTFPLDIAVPGSDLDIICEAPEAGYFLKVVHKNFSQYSDYLSYSTTINSIVSGVARFYVEDYAVELFGQPIPTRQQNGYRHMVVEARLLTLGGTVFKEKIREAKRSGLKTEPAFADLLRLPGNPYQALLDLEDLTDQALISLLKGVTN